MSLVNNIALCTSVVVKRADLMLSIPTKQKKKKKDTRKLSEVMSMFINLIVVWHHGCLQTCKLIKLYTLNRRISLAIN